jgi:3-hydroxyacyl-CoA dehydrogenase/enoyl-CoA hydratase/3-hydroxybutyryl-CoA epimerase
MAAFQTSNLRVEWPAEQLPTLLLDVADRSVNVFNRQVFADLEAALDELAKNTSSLLLTVSSAHPSKPIAGADLQEFAKVASAAEARAFSELGQKVFGKLAALRMPTLAVIQGPCLGGGLEFALACDYRLVVDHPKTQLGLPEVELGIIPGWGGTQRLPRQVGVESALKMILGGRRLNARQALRWGLADAVASSPDDVANELRRLGHLALKKGKRRLDGFPLRSWRQRILESNRLGRSMILRGAQRVLQQRVPDDMPAPAEALVAVRVGLTQGMEAGLAHERQAIGRLVTTSACRNLVGLFFAREQARKGSAESATPVRRIAVVGAGTMGAGIAQLAAVRGFEVVVQEVSEDALAAGMARIAGLFAMAVERGVLKQEEVNQKLAALRSTTNWEGFGEVDLVVEAVLEELPLKQSVFRELEKHTRPETILATNTSSLLVRQLQDGLAHPERVAGLHFFNPVHKMPLVEVIRAPRTAELVGARCTQWAAALGKTPVTVQDSPGFVVNRILMPYLEEAIHLAVEGMPVERIDQTMRRFGMPMGPLELLDQVGLDVAAHVAQSVQPSLGQRFPPNQGFEQMRQRGWLGQKSGVGFYHYQGAKKKVNTVAVALLREGGNEGSQTLTDALPAAVQAREARDRMVLLMVNEALACLDEKLAADADTIDLAMVLGTGWAPHRGGPLHYAAERGYAEVFRTMTDLAQRHGLRFTPCPALARRLNDGK